MFSGRVYNAYVNWFGLNHSIYLLVIDDLLIIRNEIEKCNNIYWDLPYPF